MNNLPDLKPCPFCGESTVYVVDGESFRYRVATCSNCGAIGPEVRMDTLAEDKESAKLRAHTWAIDEWNHRADTLPTREELESIIMGKAVTTAAGKAVVDQILARIGGGGKDA